MKRDKRLVLYAVLILLAGILLGRLFFGGGETTGRAEMVENGEETIWTCSMHPQIRQPEPGDCPICGMDLIPATTTSATDDPAVLQMTSSAVALANIQTTTVKMQSPRMEISLPGRVAVDERRTSFVTALFPGRIERLHVNFTGQQVKRGQRVASIYSPELVSAQRELMEAVNFRESNPDLYRAVRNRLSLWGLTDAQINAIEQQNEITRSVDIFARESGIVTERMVSPGDYVETGMPLLALADLENLWIVFEAYENDLLWIKEGDLVSFTATAAPGQTFEARVTFIDPVVDAMTRTATIRAETTNRQNRLMPEMIVNGRITTSLPMDQQALIIPKSAVLWTGQRSVVYLRLPGFDVPSFRMQEISLGPSLGNYYVVEEGLQPGDLIVTNGAFTIDAQAQLTNRLSMMNRLVQVAGVPGEHPAGKVIPDYSAETPVAFRNQLTKVLNAYLLVKDALVNDDAGTARHEADDAIAVVGDVDMSLVRGSAHDFWMEQHDAFKHHLAEIAGTGNIDGQRENFFFLSMAMIATIEGFGYEGTVLYLQYCPMANNDEGAYWLSREEIIANPYFGASMLRCGEVRGTYPREEEPAVQAPPAQPPGHRH